MWAIVALLLVIILAYYFVPFIRYKLIPFTGGTKAPKKVAPASLPSEDIPEQDGWINSEPLDFKQLYAQNKCVLIDFWTYTCINCIRATPYTQELWERYKDHGLVVVGVHSPEFSSIEKNTRNISAAIKKAGITYPVLTDGEMKVWRKFGNHFWPAKYLIDPSENIVYTKFGEGDYEKEEAVVRKALQQAGWNPPEYGPPTRHLELASKKVTPELYGGLGFLRKPFGNVQQPNRIEAKTFTLPESIKQNAIHLEGNWLGSYDYSESKTAGNIVLNYIANAVYVVLDAVEKPSIIEVLLDGKPIAQEVRGLDIQEKNGKTFMNIDEPRLYYPVAHKTPYGERTITFKVPIGVRLYAFTFGVY